MFTNKRYFCKINNLKNIFLGLKMQILKNAVIYLLYSFFLFSLITYFHLGKLDKYGAFDFKDTEALKTELIVFTIAASLTTFGIVSKQLYDFLTPFSNGRGIPFHWRHSIAAMLIAPIVTFGTFDELLIIESNILAALFCYQNGFFFQTILGKNK